MKWIKNFFINKWIKRNERHLEYVLSLNDDGIAEQAMSNLGWFPEIEIHKNTSFGEQSFEVRLHNGKRFYAAEYHLIDAIKSVMKQVVEYKISYLKGKLK